MARIPGTSLRRLRQLAPVIAGGALVGGLAMLALGMNHAIGTTGKRLVLQSTSDLVESLAGTIDAEMNRSTGAFIQMEGAVPAWHLTVNDPADRKSLVQLRELAGSAIALADDHGNWLSTSDGTAALPQQADPPLIGLVRRVTQTRKPALSGVMLSGDGTRVFLFGIPLHGTNRSAALVIATSYQDAGLAELVEEFGGRRGNLELVDVDRGVLSSSAGPAASAGASVSAVPLPATTTAQVTRFSSGGKDFIGISALVGSYGWAVVYKDPVDTFFGHIETQGHRLSVLLVALIALASAALLAVWQRKQSNLRAATERLEGLVENVNDVVLVVDDRIVRYASPAVAALFAWPVAEATGMPLGDLLGTAASVELTRLGSASRETGDSLLACDLPCETRDGRIIWVEATVSEKGHARGIHGTVIALHDITERREQHQEIIYQATHDRLTSLANRAKFEEVAHGALERARRSGQVLGLLYLDLDGFKPINDLHGHQAGDLVLAATASRLTGSVRVVDTVARLGGDEFAILLDGIDSEGSVEEVVERLIAAVNEPILLLDGTTVRVGISIGSATMGVESRTDYDSLLRDADLAMYRAKELGKNRHVQSTPDRPADPRVRARRP